MNIDELYRKSYKKKLNILRRIVHDVDLAEDILQETFLKVIKFQEHYNEKKGTVDTWLNSIMFNTMRDFKNKELISQDIDVDSIERDFLDPHMLYKIPKMLDQVKNPKHREVLHLYFVAGYTSMEISLLNPTMSQSNVTTIINRFRDGLIY